MKSVRAKRAQRAWLFINECEDERECRRSYFRQLAAVNVPRWYLQNVSFLHAAVVFPQTGCTADDQKSSVFIREDVLFRHIRRMQMVALIHEHSRLWRRLDSRIHFSTWTYVVFVNRRFLYIFIQVCLAHAHRGCIDSSLVDRCGWFTIQTATSRKSKLPVDRRGAFIHCSLPAFSSVPGLNAVAPNKLSEL